MKRLAFLIVLLALAAHLNAQRSDRARAGDDLRPAPVRVRAPFAIPRVGPSCDDPDCPLRHTTHPHEHAPTFQPVSNPPPPTTDEPAVVPGWFDRDPAGTRPGVAPRGLVTVRGAPSISEARAERDARAKLDRLVADWLAPEVSGSWRAGDHLVEPLIVDRYIRPEVRDYGDHYTLYRAGYRVDFAPQHRARIVEEHDRQVVAGRLVVLGGGLAFVLACLAAVSGYIRADEATRGYYTNRLRLAAAGAVGAAGMAIYRMLT